MSSPQRNGRFNIPDYDGLEDEAFPPLPPPHSPGQGGREDGDPFGNEDENGDVSKLADVPAAKRKGVRRPQPKLDSQRLISDRGLPALRTLFEDVQFKGKGREAEDLRLLMHKMENWAHRLYPKLQFDDFIDRVEKLGNKKEVQTCLKRIRLDMPLTHQDFIGEDEPAPEQHVFADPDPFDSAVFPDDLQRALHSTPAPAPPPSSSFPSPAAPSLTEEQRRRIELNRQRALERKLARQQTDSQTADSSARSDEPTPVSSVNDLHACKAEAEEEEKEEAEEDLHPEPDSSSTQQPKESAHRDSEACAESAQCEGEESSLSAEPEHDIEQEDGDSKS
uniref:TIMELESS-interacting protein n=1 Tax=Labrus bergylta TaxID=56723 RepID=A0A3Q3FZA0_9LABR|nr:TIMELESS-interacting protein [Labrus bergylta]XP_020511709.1 TIMELESS-interacting protein [Labrus bergylta]